MANCIKCMNNIDGNEIVFECDICRKKLHRECVGLSSSEERIMSFKKRVVMLICEPCQNVMQKVSDMLIGFDSIKKDVEEVKHFINNIEKNSTYRKSENVSQNVQVSKFYKDAVVNNKNECW